MNKQQIKQILARVPKGHDPKITITCREKLALIEENEKLKANAEKLVRYGFERSSQGFNFEYPFSDSVAFEELDHWVSEWTENALKELSND